MSIVFTTLTADHIDEAIALAEANLAIERRHVPSLPADAARDYLHDAVRHVVTNGTGIAAIESDRLVGYMTFYGPIEHFFGNVPGAVSPIHASAASGEHRERLYAQLFQHAADRLVRDGMTSLGVTVYAHDEDANRALIRSGFGIRNADAIRDLSVPLGIAPNDAYTYAEATEEDLPALVPLENGLIRHLRTSPIFMPVQETTEEAFLERHREQGSRFFVARSGRAIVGYIKVTGEGENFLTMVPEMPNITGAYLLPEHRGNGVYGSLLSFTIDVLRDGGARLLGVDFETLNPTALHFWEKAFDIYTHGLARRIDEGILEHRS